MPRESNSDRRFYRRNIAGLLVFSLITLAAVPFLLGPKCPTRLVIATGGSDGAYYSFAERYKTILAKSGIELQILETSGSVENQNLLLDQDSNVSLAIVQGGISDGAATQLEALASLYQEPVWVFYRSEKIATRISELPYGQIAIGPEGSGTRAIATELLRDCEIPLNAPGRNYVDVSGKQAVSQLKDGTIDAAFMVVSASSPLISELMACSDIRLMSFERASAVQQRHPFLSRAVLPEGVVNMHRNTPANDVQLIAPTANLVVRDDFHHALVPLFLKAIQEVHTEGGVLAQSGTFPTDKFTDFPVNVYAEKYFEAGPSWLYKYLPFTLAAWLDRVKLILLPLCTLLIPLLKFTPPVYRWRIRSRIYRWYRVLHDIDQQLAGENLVSAIQCQTRLAELEKELHQVNVPLSYMEEFYNLRIHVSFVDQRIRQQLNGDELPRLTSKAA